MRDRYEPVSNFDFPSLVNVDAVGETDDTELITSHSMNNEDDSFRKTITFHDLFHNVQFSHRHRLYIGIVTGTSCTTIMLMIALSFGFGKVLFDTFAQEEKLRHGLKMIPNLWSKPTNVFYFSVRNGTANREYVQEIDDYIAKYMEYQEKIKNYLKNCTVKDRRDEGQWCSFDIRQALGSECSKASNYGYNSGNPCILFAFENYLGWKPNMKSEVDYLPFSCRLQYQYSSNVYLNITYYPTLPTTARSGGFQMNLISNEKIIDNDGKEITGSDGKTLFASPPLVMVKLTFNSVLSRNESSSFGPFTMDCRLKDNLAEYHFDNLRDFRGRTAVFFDFVPRFS